RLLHFEVALRFRLFGLRERLGEHALLIGLGFGNRRFARCLGALDRRIALGFSRRYVRIALDAGNVGAAHIGDVFVLVAYFFDRERNYLETHLVHVIGAGGAHAVADHLWLLDDLFHRELADDAAQMSFHDQANETLALFRRLGEKLLGGGKDRFRIRLHL